jgi:hypothetical protein
MRLPSVKQAFALHFFISLLVFLVLLALMMWVWFPGKLFFIDGGWQGMKIIAPVDLVLGPALTLLLYRPWKKSLKFDMSVIAAIQIAALSYGVYSAYNQRTAAIVFAENRFETLSLNEFRAAQDELEAQNLPVVPLSKFGKMPVLVHAPGYDYGKYLEDILNGKPELRERSDLYQPIRESLDLIAEFAVNERGEPIEIPASSTPTDAPATPMKFNLKARYDSAVITVYEKGFKIEQVGH